MIHLPSLSLIELALSFTLTGLIWTIQLVHYPSFTYIDAGHSRSFHLAHQRRISYLVVPLMIGELFVTSWLSSGGTPWSIVNLCLTLLIWLSTFFLSVPLHQSLLLSHSSELTKRLVLTNWPRTALWSLKSLLCLLLFKG